MLKYEINNSSGTIVLIWLWSNYKMYSWLLHNTDRQIMNCDLIKQKVSTVTTQPKTYRDNV